jgi:ABC-type nitrate/sulfonate/bicarbonate transport system ATPase subunit
MQQLIKEIWCQSGTTIVFITHNTREAVCLGSRVVALARNGEKGSSVALDVAVPRLDFESDEDEIRELVDRVESATQPGIQRMQSRPVPSLIA